VEQVSDDFTGTSLGPNWRVAYGAFSESGGAARGTGHDSYAVWVGSPPADASVTVTLGAPTTPTFVGVIGRANPAEPEVDHYATYVDHSNTINLARRNDWSYTELATGPVVSGGGHKLGLTMSGSGPVKLQVTLDGAAVITATDSSPQALTKAGSAGIFDFDGASRPFQDFTVAAGSCNPPPPPSCGDGACNGTEDCDSCPADCGSCPAVCYDGECEPGETCESCPADCGPCLPTCGDLHCDRDRGENCENCFRDCGTCTPSTCGDSVCNGTEDCASCPFDCGPCASFCGNDICTLRDENCRTCPLDCGDCAATCGNGTCDPAENCVSCPDDCGLCRPICGDSHCDAGEDCATCPDDCGACP
jgi:hypothetical protein